jgi:hypothetical protein
VGFVLGHAFKSDDEWNDEGIDATFFGLCFMLNFLQQRLP